MQLYSFHLSSEVAEEVNAGRTRAFRTHEDASVHFLGRPCAPSNRDDNARWPQCNGEIPLFTRAARDAGLDSLQFTSHCDDRCTVCATELVLTRGNGSYGCPDGVEYRGGYPPHLHACKCIPWLKSTLGRGRCAACEDATRRLTRLQAAPSGTSTAPMDMY